MTMGDDPLSYAIPIAIEFAGVFILLLGIAVELSTGADLGYLLISFGSTIITAGSVVWAKIVKGKRK